MSLKYRLSNFRKEISALKASVMRLKYHIGLIPITCSTDILNTNITDHIIWIKGCPKDRWFADPFIIKVHNDEIHLLVEELNYKIGKGAISLLVVSRSSYRLIRRKLLLRDETHYSFPFIFRTKTATFVIPENGESGKVKCFYFDEVREELLFERELMPGEYADLVFLNHNNHIYFYGTMLPDPNGRTCVTGKDCVKSEEHIVLRDNCARSAGDFFRIGETIYKPNQDCNGAYGRGIVIFKMEETKIGEELIRIYPKYGRYSKAFHTFNVYDSYIAVDGRGYRYWGVYYLLGFIGIINRHVLGRKK